MLTGASYAFWLSPALRDDHAALSAALRSASRSKRFPATGLSRAEHRIEDGHVGNRILERYGHTAPTADGQRKLLGLHRGLVDHRKRQCSNPATEHIPPIIDEHAARLVGRSIEGDLDFHACPRAVDVHALVGRELRGAAEHALARWE